MNNRYLFQKCVAVLISVSLICCISSCGLSRHTVDDIYGFWESVGDEHYVAYIHDNFIDVFCFNDDSEKTIDWFNSWSGSFVPPDGSFSSYSWVSDYDYDRSNSMNRWWSHDHELYSSRTYEYKNNRLYRYYDLGNPTVFVKSKTIDSEILDIVNRFDSCANRLTSVLPLETGDIKLYREMSEQSNNVYNTVFCIEVINPNPFRIFNPEIEFFDGEGDLVACSRGCRYIESDSNVEIVGGINIDNTIETLSCEIHYNTYSTYDVGETPTIEIIDSSILSNGADGNISQVEVSNQVDRIPEPQTELGEEEYWKYNLYVVFYKNESIVGVGYGHFDLGTIDEADCITNISRVSDYDAYMIYVG